MYIAEYSFTIVNYRYFEIMHLNTQLYKDSSTYYKLGRKLGNSIDISFKSKRDRIHAIIMNIILRLYPKPFAKTCYIYPIGSSTKEFDIRLHCPARSFNAYPIKIGISRYMKYNITMYRLHEFRPIASWYNMNANSCTINNIDEHCSSYQKKKCHCVSINDAIELINLITKEIDH